MLVEYLHSIRVELVAHVLHSSIFVDRLLSKMLHLYQRTRTTVVLGFVSDEALQRLGALAYGKMKWYLPHDESSWPDLFDWERRFVEERAPVSPARVLVGGAGAGREAYHLARMGYDVTAFDPIESFVQAMQREIPSHLPVHAYQARYEDLPRLGSIQPGESTTDLTTLPPFEFGIFGWSSFSHILDHDDRVQTLKVFASVVDGPILLSFFSRNPKADLPSSVLGRWRRHLPGRNQDPAFDFQINTGIYRGFTEQEMVELCNQANLRIDDSNIEKGYSHSSWVVVTADGHRVCQ